MRKRACLLFLPVLLTMMTMACPWTSTGAAVAPPSEGGTLPDFNLPVSEKAEEMTYLGIQAKDRFKVPQIQADLVIIEIFNMYCPHCQREAPAVNELYKNITDRADLKSKVKLIGIGAGNSPFEVNLFRTKYDIPFPLFSDADYSAHKALGQVPTPFFIALKINEDGSHKVVHSHPGSIGVPGQFMDIVLEKAHLK